ncbi:hypothetical protein BGZ65_005612 [Modicella reniformis]|uniref:CsbD-like domain-containing protein n=1 Tax=Modicella reniformis TaxID=1440133 RepID=A0A9P6MKY6_9FUNG|nr:hypothetical protein BGZ65_005612 [Modicella reniformis]
MSDLGNKLSNTANSYIGGAKQTVGEKLGYPDLAATGAQQKSEADAKAAAAVAQAKFEGDVHKVQGQIEQKIGQATGDSSLEARGHANETRGDLERRAA